MARNKNTSLVPQQPLEGEQGIEIPFRPSNIETVDFALHEWLEERMNIFSDTFRGWKQIPVIWVSAERAVLSKKSQSLRDDDGMLILPVMTLERTGVEKDLRRKGIIQAHLPEMTDGIGGVGGQITIAKKINVDKTGDFANASSAVKWGDVGTGGPNFNVRGRRTKKVVYDIYSIPTPVYVTAKYEINIKTEYQEQMNEILTPLVVYTGGVNQFILQKDGHRYEAFVGQTFTFDNSVNNLGETERVYQTKITIDVLAYLLGEGPNRDTPRFARRENAVEVRLPRERVIVGDIPDWLDRSFFRGGEIAPTHQFRDIGTDAPKTPLMPNPRSGGVVGGGGGKVVIEDEGVVLTQQVATMDFVGGGISATTVGNDVTVTVAGSSAIPVADEGSSLTSAVSSFDFTGAGLTATADGDAITVNVDASAITAKEEGANLTTSMSSVNFAGPNVVATTSGDDVTVTVSGSYITAQDEGVNLSTNVTSLDFVGAGVTATNTAGAITVTITGSTDGATINNSIFSNSTYSQVPTGDVDGINTVYTTSQDFIDGSELLFHNGILMRKGGTYDYTTTGDDEITFTDAPLTDDFILISYVNKTAS